MTYTYDDWAHLLADFFFDPAHRGEEVLFAVDELSLAEASGLAEGAASTSLGHAVRSEIGSHWSLGALDRWVERWRKSGCVGPHPALPFLALTVLAASRMGDSDTIAPHNYYVPLRQLLDSSDSGKGAPGDYTEHVERLWPDLQRWANNDLAGGRGRLVVRDPGFYRYVGLAMQHALVKSADLRQLDAFFRRIGLLAGEAVSPAELRRALGAWTAGRSEPWARRLYRLATMPELEAYCEALLEREAARWDGRPRDPRTGRPVGRVRLMVTSLRRPSIGVVPQWDDRLPESLTAVMPSGDETEMKRDRGWFAPHPLPDVDIDGALTTGLQLRTTTSSFDLRAEHVYALAYDDDLGAWVSVDSMTFGDRYHLLVDRSSVGAVLQFLAAASQLSSRVDADATRFLPSGWSLVREVRLDSRPESGPPAPLASLVPAGRGPRLRLLGGLPIGVAQSTYLRGGEPAVALSTLGEDEFFTVLDETRGIVARFPSQLATNREIPLWDLRLPPGQYLVEQGGATAPLRIVDGIVEAAGPGAGSVRQRGRDDVEVVGTSTSAVDLPGTRPVTVPAPLPGDYVVVIGAGANEHLVVKLPSWLTARTGELSWKQIDAWPAFEPVWALRREGPTGWEATLLQKLDPEVTGDVSRTEWARLIADGSPAAGQSEAAAALWQSYEEAASSTR